MKSDWWLNPQTHLKTHEGNRRKRKRWSRRWGSGRGKREAGRNILDVSDVFIGLGWCRKVKWKQATQSEASSFHHNHQPSHMNHEPWSEIELFTSCHFFSPWSEKRFTQLTPWTPEKQDKEKLPKERTQAIKTYIFALCYIYTPFSEVACAKIKILKLFAVNSRVDFFFFFLCVRAAAARFLTCASLSCRSSCVPSEILFFLNDILMRITMKWLPGTFGNKIR